VEILQAIGADGIGPQIAVVFVGLLFMAVWWRSPVLRGWRPSAPQQREWMNFVLGAAVLTGCFFAGQHFAYRWIFAVLMAPFLWTLSHAPEAPLNARRFARILAWLLITILWTEAVFVFVLHGMPHATMMAALNWISLGMQPLTWAFFVCLLGFLVHFARLTLHEVCGWQSA
jgi:hypothetical protein